MSKKNTKQIILDAAEKVFFENGYEKTSIKMILQESGTVTGSFYHFFPSKEAAFEAVADRFLERYAQRISSIIEREDLNLNEKMELFSAKFLETSDRYYNVLQGDKLHWSMQLALHERTLDSIAHSLSVVLKKQIEEEKIHSSIDVDELTLSRILIRGVESILHQDDVSYEKAQQHIRDFILLVLKP